MMTRAGGGGREGEENVNTSFAEQMTFTDYYSRCKALSVTESYQNRLPIIYKFPR